MSKNKLGTKRQCPSCGAKYYDLNRTPITCPKCQHIFDQGVEDELDEIEIVDDPIEKLDDEVIKSEDGPEIISLEEADSEQMGETGTELDSDESIGTDDEEAFITDDDSDDDVADIVVGSEDDEDN